mmetsp:Transcript_102776/g.219808  ORF Transcript_102776/g.219808 Transcript_102776/m.219808 type:complete len:306 (-) Transcript_102776:1215-2132(-)
MENEGNLRNLLLEVLRLLHILREAVEEEAICILMLLHCLLQELQLHFVGHLGAVQLVLLDFGTEMSAGRDLRIHEAVNTEVDEVELLGDLGDLCPLAAARTSGDEDHEGRCAQLGDAHGLHLLRHIDLDDLLLRHWRWGLHSEGHAVGIDAVLHKALRPLRRVKGLRQPLRHLVRVVLEEPPAQPLHRRQALGLHLAERMEATRKQLLHGRVDGEVSAVGIRQALEVHRCLRRLSEEEVPDLVVVRHGVGAHHLREEEAHLTGSRLRGLAAVHSVALAITTEAGSDAARPQALRILHGLGTHELL